MSNLLWVLGGLFLLILFSGGYMFVVACFRKKELPWLDADAMKSTTFGQYAESIVLAQEWLMEHNAQSVSITSHDGLILRGYWIPAENPKGTILLAHGYRSSFLLDFGAAFEYYHDIGFNILVPSQRSHGLSQGRIITFGIKESEDFLRWIDFHNQKLGHYPLILSGMSMGASTVLYMADRQLPENVKGIIADCGFTSPKDILEKVYRSLIKLPAAPTLWAVELFARVIGGFSLTEKDSRKSLANAGVPVLLIHGEADDFVPHKMTLDGYEACNGKKSILIVKNAGHGVSFLESPKEYSEKVLTFLREILEDYSI